MPPWQLPLPCLRDQWDLVRPSMSFLVTRPLRLRLVQVEPHVHLAIHRRGGSQVLVTLLLLARAPVHLAEAEVAVGDDGPPSLRLGRHQGFPIAPPTLFEIEAIGMNG